MCTLYILHHRALYNWRNFLHYLFPMLFITLKKLFCLLLLNRLFLNNVKVEWKPVWVYSGLWLHLPWSSLVEGDEGCIGPSCKLLCCEKSSKNIQHVNGNIPSMLDGWADPVVHHRLLKSSMLLPIWVKLAKYLNLPSFELLSCRIRVKS